ncbi:MAG: DMT family transporter [Rhodobacteraceae bacterium]|nr:DMT family transporter [Paracoccaceae bacterium]
MGVFATHDVVIKILGADYSPFQIVFFGTLFGFPIVSVILLRDAEEANLRPRHPWWMALRTLCSVIAAPAVFYAFATLPLAQVYTILFAAPLILTVLAVPILGEVVRFRRWAAVIVGLIGVLIVMRPGGAELSLGHLAALTGAVGGALISVISRKIGQNERTVVLLLFPMVANFAAMAVALPFVYRPMPLDHLALFAVIAVLGMIGAYLIILAYRAGEAVIVAPMQYSQILWATGYGILFFAERPDMPTMVGAAIIIASGIYIVLREGRRDVSRTRPVLETGGRMLAVTTPRISVLRRMMSAGERSGR